MKTILAAIGLAFALSTFAFADTYVHGYYKSNGTYVAPHYRSSPDSSYNNNWSVSPNVNPYTGKQGARQPTFNDRPPSSGFELPNNTYRQPSLNNNNVYQPRRW